VRAFASPWPGSKLERRVIAKECFETIVDGKKEQSSVYEGNWDRKHTLTKCLDLGVMRESEGRTASPARLSHISERIHLLGLNTSLPMLRHEAVELLLRYSATALHSTTLLVLCYLFYTPR